MVCEYKTDAQVENKIEHLKVKIFKMISVPIGEEHTDDSLLTNPIRMIWLFLSHIKGKQVLVGAGCHVIMLSWAFGGDTRNAFTSKKSMHVHKQKGIMYESGL